MFFSHNKSANGVFQPTYQNSQTVPKSDLAEHLTFEIMSQPYAGEWAGGQNHGINSRTCFDDSSYADEFRRQARPQLLQFQVNTVYAFWNRD
jgi:hypothetical protein